MKIMTALALVIVLSGCAKSEGDTCFQTLRDSLKDPESATLVEWHAIEHVVKVDIRAQYPAGGFGHIYGVCRPNGTHELIKDKLEWTAL